MTQADTNVAAQSLGEFIGPAEVTFPDGRVELFEEVRLYGNGVLRVAAVTRWETDNGYGWCEGEHSVAYLAPGHWAQVKPQIKAGTLFVRDDRGVHPNLQKVVGQEADPERLAQRVSLQQAHRIVVDYLVKRCDMSAADAEAAVAENFSTPSCPGREIRFELAQALEPQKESVVA